MTELTAHQTLAIAKAVKDAAYKKASQSVVVPEKEDKIEQAVDFTVQIRGTVTKFGDEKYNPVAELPVYGLLIRLYGMLRGAAQQRQLAAFEEMIVNSMHECIAHDLRGEEKTAQFCEAEAEFERLKERAETMFDKLPEKTRTGKVTAKLTVIPVTATMSN